LGFLFVNQVDQPRERKFEAPLQNRGDPSTPPPLSNLQMYEIEIESVRSRAAEPRAGAFSTRDGAARVPGGAAPAIVE
jgi:hypothetical protein